LVVAVVEQEVLVPASIMAVVEQNKEENNLIGDRRKC
jgi:hypothetical protein